MTIALDVLALGLTLRLAPALAVALPAPTQHEEEAARLAGAATVFDDGPDAFGYPVAVLNAAQRRAFMVGNALFKTNWVAAPASAEGMDGLGPLFNARSCSSCHLRDGRGQPPLAEVGDGESSGFLLRISVVTAADAPGVPHAVYGTQLQDRAVDDLRPEGRLRIREERRRGRYADGTEWELAAPSYEVVDAGYGPLGEHVALGPRVAPQLIGLGLLENVPEEALVARADPDDRDGDGISGRPRWVTARGRRALGRFGWKASQPTVRSQAAAAFANDMGITSTLFPADDATPAELAAIGGPKNGPKNGIGSGGEPELSDHKLDRVAFYSAMLAVPAQRDVNEPGVHGGERLFRSIGCAACHVPELETGDGGEIEGLRRQRLRPYSDLLLHDLGDGLADGIAEEGVTSAEWRTPPLWGIGLFEVVNGHHRYLHDGRARNLEEAILWHGGEAGRAAAAFQALAAADRELVLEFLRSL